MAKRFKAFRRFVNGVLQQKVVERDLAQYPDTALGDASMLAAMNAGTLTVIDRPADSKVIGVALDRLVDNRLDYVGFPLTTSRGAALIDATRTNMRPTGNDFPLAPQTAKNTVLLNRIPPFMPHSSKQIVYAGHWFSAGDMIPFYTAFTHVAESVPSPNTRAPLRINFTVPGGYDVAQEVVNTLPDSDARKVWFQDWLTGNHRLMNNEAAARYFGRRLYQSIYPGNVHTWSLNFEVHEPNPRSGNSEEQQWMNMVAWTAWGIVDEAISRGNPVPFFTSYEGCILSPFAPTFYDQPQGGGDPEPGMPQYMNRNNLYLPYRGGSSGAPIGTSSPMAQLLTQHGGAVGQVEYMNYTWDNQTFFKKNSDGSYQLSGGVPIWRDDARVAVVMGTTAQIDPGVVGDRPSEAYGYAQLIYSRLSSMMTDRYFLSGGKHIWKSTDRQTGLQKWKQMFWYRIDTQGITPGPDEVWNRRPLNPEYAERDGMLMYLYCDVIRGWSETREAIATGGVSNHMNKANGSIEMYVKGFYRASQLNWIFSQEWYNVQPRLWMKNQGVGESLDADEHFAKKPIIVGGICPSRTDKANKPWLWLLWSYPVQEATQQTEVLVWIDKGSGPITPSYKLLMDGRRTGLDACQLPDACATAEPKHIYFQFTDMLGTKQTWRGDYREAKITSHPTPPALATT